ncbi:MAG: V-type ATP synthase subunit D [Chloroflexi bacterium]|jgi:V/A-type H+-transporting ATPase subunit D|nr:V-type ATP synthase subunit D [Chloroflexota bacterium]
MSRLQISPTRSNLLEVRHSLNLARQGFELLDRKRDVLIMEILRVIGEAEHVQTEVQERFARAYQTMEEARATIGTERMRRISLSRTQEVDVHITPRSIMGVVVPSVSYRVPESKLLYGFGDTSVVLDQTQQDWAAVLALIGELAEKVTTVWRLAMELRSTQRRVNALENIFIPSYEATLRYIEEAMEEKDREELFRMKRAKDYIESERRDGEQEPPES